MFRTKLISLSASVALVAVSLFAVPASRAHGAAVPPPENDGTASLPSADAFGDVEQVASFVSDIVVNMDGSIDVTEHIDYVFPEPRHGIYRDIPTRYEMDNGDLLEVPVTVVEVLGSDDQPVQYEVQRNKVGIRIKIGDPDVEISGSQSYDIKYVARGAIRYFADHDELYWNVTGNAWEVPLSRVAANITLPTEAVVTGTEGNKLKCFTGEAGSTATNCVYTYAGNSTYAFAANDAMTVVVAWPPGIVARLEARTVSKTEQQLPYLAFLIPVVALVLMYRKWNRDGRDPKGRGTHMVEYDPPDALTPSETGVLFDGNAGNQDISAMIVDLAVRGYLIIRETEAQGLIFKSKDIEFERLKDFADDASLKSFEKRLLTALFPADGKIARVSEIKKEQVFYKEMPEISSRVYEELVQQGYYPKNPNKVKQTWAVIGIVVMIAGGVVAVMLSAILGEEVGIKLAIAIVLSGVIVLAFSPFMSKVTEKGALAKERVEGFKDYLQTAEKYRLQWQEKENIFERFLPYAMAYGVADKWAKAFATMQLAQPSWYQGSAVHGGVFNPILFAGAMKDMNTLAVAAMTSQPSQSSSGSGFGGSSGGGSGGGGGGSW